MGGELGGGGDRGGHGDGGGGRGGDDGGGGGEGEMGSGLGGHLLRNPIARAAKRELQPLPPNSPSPTARASRPHHSQHAAQSELIMA